MQLNFCNVLFFFCGGTIWKNYFIYLSCLVSSSHAVLLTQFVVLDAYKGSTHDCLKFVGLVSYQVPLAAR